MEAEFFHRSGRISISRHNIYPQLWVTSLMRNKTPSKPGYHSLHQKMHNLITIFISLILSGIYTTSQHLLHCILSCSSCCPVFGVRRRIFIHRKVEECKSYNLNIKLLASNIQLRSNFKYLFLHSFLMNIFCICFRLYFRRETGFD